MTRRRPALWLNKPVRRHPERDEQASIVRLLRTVGGETWVSGTTRRRGDYQGTMMTPGWPDVVSFLPAPDGGRVLLVVEVKGLGGRLRPDQVRFRDCCLAAGIAHVTGGVDAVIAWLVDHDYLNRNHVAWYRLPMEDPDAVSQP